MAPDRGSALLETNHSGTFGTPAFTVEMPPEMAAGLDKTAAEIAAINQAEMNRMYSLLAQRDWSPDYQLGQMTQQQAMNALQQTPYWKQMYGYLGMGGDFFGHKGGK